MHEELYKYFRNKTVGSLIMYILVLTVFDVFQFVLLPVSGELKFMVSVFCVFIDVTGVIFIVNKVISCLKIGKDVSISNILYTESSTDFDCMLGDIRNKDTVVQVKCGRYIAILSRDSFNTVLSYLGILGD